MGSGLQELALLHCYRDLKPSSLKTHIYIYIHIPATNAGKLGIYNTKFLHLSRVVSTEDFFVMSGVQHEHMAMIGKYNRYKHI